MSDEIDIQYRDDAIKYFIHKIGYPEVQTRDFNRVIYQILLSVCKYENPYFSLDELAQFSKLIEEIRDVEDFF